MQTPKNSPKIGLYKSFPPELGVFTWVYYYMNYFNRNFIARLVFCTFTALQLLKVSAKADEAKNMEFFEKKVRPLLLEHCSKCHSSQEKKTKGGLDLDTRESTLQGGDTKAAIVPGKPTESLLIQSIGYNSDIKMPPKGKLSEQAIADLTEWVKMGAPDPRTKTAAKKNSNGNISNAADWWSFQPMKKDFPSLANLPKESNPIDYFILEKLKGAGIAPAKEASRTVLIRRLYLDLVGLPPTPEKILAFENDTSVNAYEKLVDELLQSPHFGERWARHWLDVVRFAQSSGGGRTAVFPDAWRYRDYVIQSFQKDKSFQNFIHEQIAGDLLEAKTNSEREANLVATGFLAMGPTNFERQDKKILEMDVVDEQLDTIGKAFMGMTIGCSRCHDHKFDPIPTKDYYSMAGIFKSTKTLIHDNVSRWVDRQLPMDPEDEKKLADHNNAIARLEQQIKASKGGKPSKAKILALADIEGIVVDDSQAKKVGNWTISTFKNHFIGEGYSHDDNADKGEKTICFTPEIKTTGKYDVYLAYVEGTNRAENVPVTIFHAEGEKVVHVNMQKAPDIEGRFIHLGQFKFENSGQGFVLVSNTGTKGHVVADAVQFLPTDQNNKIVKSKIATAETKSDVKQLEGQLKELKSKSPTKVVAMGVDEEKKIGDINICIRGNVHTPGAIAPRGFIQAVKVENPPKIPNNQSGRKEFAQWLGDSTNSLTHRVYVNRIWHWLFGSGLVRTTDNFGTTGETPSHPELLDFLTTEFIRNNYSTKKMIRLMVTSKTYRQSSENSSADIDTDNRLFGKMNRKRLEAEVIRDSMLSVSNRLDLTNGGANMPANLSTEYGYKFTDTRRSIYTPVFRNTLPELFEVFDFPDPNLVIGKRNVSTIAPQALYLMNNPFVIAESQAAAKELLQIPDFNDYQRAERMYLIVIGRHPTGLEKEKILKFLASDGKRSPQESWALLFQAMFSTLDFRYYH